jgi:hypothetical protein
MLGGDDTSFPIVEDVYFGSDNIFRNSAAFYGFDNLVGRWDNCEWISVVDNAFYANTDISATITNVVMGDITNRAFNAQSGNLSGTITNVVMGDVGVVAFRGGS